MASSLIRSIFCSSKQLLPSVSLSCSPFFLFSTSSLLLNNNNNNENNVSPPSHTSSEEDDESKLELQAAADEETTSSLIPPLKPSPLADQLSSIILAYHNPFHVSESTLQLSGITLTRSLLLQTLLRLRHSSKLSLSLFTWAHSHHSSPVGPDSFHVIIDSLGRARQFDVVWQLIMKMDSPGPTPTALLILIRRLVAAGLTRQAIRAYKDMECLTGLRPEYTHFVYLIDTLCKYGYVKAAMEVFNNKHERFREFDPDVKMYTILIYGWVKINRTHMGEKLLKEMVERHGLEPNVVTYNVLLNGICRRASLHPEERFEKTVRAAGNLLGEMRERGVEPDVTSYSIILHVYSRAHRPELTLDKLKEMKGKGICPSVVTYTSVVKCLCSCGRLDDAEELLDEMVRCGVSPTAATYNCFFKEYRGRKDSDRALKLYRKMREESPHLPSANTYNILVAMFVRLHRMDFVKEIWNDMKEMGGGVGPDLDTYTLLIHELCKERKWREACQYFVEMIERGMLPQKITFETLYKGLIQSDMLRTWRRLKKRLDEESISFGSEFDHYHLKPYRR